MMRVLLFLLVACGSSGGPPSPSSAPASATDLDLPTPEAFARAHPHFDAYWTQGLAELTRFRLRQSRYGEVHDGEAVLIFVTEPFLPDLQVKHEHGDLPSISVLKLNAYRRFYTGIYPYTITTSSFQPVAGGPALKVATSVQEWCGIAYAQLNRRAGHVQAVSHSYFQDEADQALQLPDVPFEDALWAKLRRDPESVPTGVTRMVPALHWLRLRHRDLRPYEAEVSLAREGDRQVLQVRYPQLGRRLRVAVDARFPHAVHSWEEVDDRGRTTAERTHAILTDYWNHNGVADAPYREALGLEY